MIVRLAHLCFQTNRFGEMTAFYRDVLGLPNKFSLRLPDGRIFGHYFTIGDTSFMELFDTAGACEMWGGTPGPRGPQSGSSFQHFCLEVKGIESVRRGIIDSGCDVTGVTKGMDGSLQAWIKDPDGNDIELMEYTKDSLQLAETRHKE